ncbi:hypothetical protein FKM82_016756 [Ascaphus truei]
MATAKVMSSGDREFECVELGDVGKKKKAPRRIIHFASGETMEEYSTDEEEERQTRKDLLPTTDPTRLTWGPYLWFYMLRAATSTLTVCDFLGEKIASVLGVSTPKYQYAIDEYYRMQKEVCIHRETNLHICAATGTLLQAHLSVKVLKGWIKSPDIIPFFSICPLVE